MLSQQPLDSAIIGVAGIYPGAGNARQYWQNILDKVDAVRDAEPAWVGSYFEENATDDDRIYTKRGGFLGDHARVNPQLYGVMPTVAAGADPDRTSTRLNSSHSSPPRMPSPA